MKKWIKRILGLTAFLVLGSVIGALIINLLVVNSVKDRILTEDMVNEIGADAILILGAAVRPDKTPSPMLEDRLIQGINLYKQGSAPKILVSGDNGTNHYDEVTVMKNYVVSHEVPSVDVFKDHAGFNTYNSLYRAGAIFKIKRVIIVTQEYHLYRALYIGNRLGLDVYGVASDPRTYTGQEARDFREVLARVKDFFLTILKPEPVYLGDEIPITGNGDTY